MTSELPSHFCDVPVSLLAAAFRAGQELAWPRNAAIEVINWLSRHGRAVEGIEVWLPSEPGPEIPFPFVYAWTLAPKAASETWPDFVRRAKHEALSYIRNFNWDDNDLVYHGREPLFNLDVTTQGERLS